MATPDRIAGIKVSPLRGEQFLAEAADALRGRSSLRVTFLNPDYARRALLDPTLLDDINRFERVLVDGNGIRLVAPMFGFTVPERLDTDTIAPRLFRLCAAGGHSVYLFGCAPGVADQAAMRLGAAFPGLRVAGTDHGYHDVRRGHPGRYAAEDSADIVDRINASGAELALVSLPTPLQQRWVTENGHLVRAHVVITAGSYLDHVAAGIDGSWYPRWADALRLNWFYRLLQEPRRLWRRYTLEGVHFLLLVVRARLRGG
jgi:N-acetylglucosaminyldiphosphoundecaprenol N-acetyl-beta-D-mannosaminyltransferase